MTGQADWGLFQLKDDIEHDGADWLGEDAASWPEPLGVWDIEGLLW
jgi:hypothetical protein